MKAFLAYRGSEENQAELLHNLKEVVDTFAESGNEVYCTHLQEEPIQKGSKMRTAFQKIDNSDALIVLLKQGNKSEGMLLEIGYAYGKKPIYIFAEKGLDAASLELATNIYYWAGHQDLLKQIRGFQND